MSKAIKQMEMDILKKTFTGVKEYVFLTVSKLDAQQDWALRLALRKKKIRVQMVKNTLARRVFRDLGIPVDNEDYWKGTTWLTWGPESVAELSKEIETAVVKNATLREKVKIKGALAEGLPVPFDQALKMPTRPQAIGTIIAMILGPASQIASQLLGPVSQVASQIESKTKEEKPAETPAPAPASA